MTERELAEHRAWCDRMHARLEGKKKLLRAGVSSKRANELVGLTVPRTPLRPNFDILVETAEWRSASRFTRWLSNRIYGKRPSLKTRFWNWLNS